MGEILASLFESVLFSIFLVLFLKPKKGRNKLFLGIVLSSGLLFLNIFISDLYSLYNVYSLMMDLIITAFFWWFFLKGTLTRFLRGFALYHFGLYLSSYLSTLAISLARLDMVLAFQSINTSYRVEILLLSKMLLLLYTVTVIHFRTQFRLDRRGISTLCYSVLPIFVLALFVLLTSTFAELYRMEPVLSIKMIGIIAGIHFTVIVTIYLSIHAVRKAGKEYDVEKLHYMLHIQRESLEKFIGQEQQLYRLQHELEHKLFTVQYLFEKNQKEEGFRVLEQMIVELCGDAKNISVSQNIVETVITNIEKKYETEAIRIEKEILFPDETIMELVDLCILLGDLLDNAMEAAAGSAEKQVRISVREEFNCLYLQISNTFSEKNSDVKSFVSKKGAGRHGFGMKNIREIVKRYGGELITYHEGGWFYSNVIIYGQK